MKVLAVGDIHQKDWILDRVEKIIDNYDKIVFVGDYADDWKSAPEDRIVIWREIRSFEARHSPKVKLVAGNHDYIYAHKEFAGMYSGWNAAAQLMLNSEKSLKEWILNLPLFQEIDGVVYSHAGITDSWDSNSSPLSHDGPLWNRPDWGYVYEPKQVFGHTPSRTCWEVQKDVWCIDTFSTYMDGTPFGDNTVLEIKDGKEFKKFKLKG